MSIFTKQLCTTRLLTRQLLLLNKKDTDMLRIGDVKITDSQRVNIVKNMLSISLFASIFVLSGCNDRIALADNRMAGIREKPAQPVEPPPQPELVDDYVYNASDVRSPFMAPSLLNYQEKVESTESIAPDLNRTKEPLEDYELTALVYRGLVVSPEGEQFGLIQRPDGIVDSVKVGDYMGMNDGRIVEITPTQINLIEIIPDSRAGYAEKPASVVAPI